MNRYQKDCLGLGAMVMTGLALCPLMLSGSAALAGFGVEGLMLAFMFAPCLAWRLVHKDHD